MTMNGFVLVDKPVGSTSNEVTHTVRRAIGGKGGRRGLKIGHAGTLDPFATGLVMVLVGRATRLMPYVVGCDKRYEMTMLLGRTSDTDDATGILAAPSSRDAHVPQAGERMLIADEVMAPQTTQALPGEDQIRSAVAEVAARTEQVPPAVSALHIDGQRAHVRVRNGETITVSPRPVRIDEATIGAIGAWHLDDEGAQVCTVELDVRCASGTYLRALARDVGELLGVGGLAMALRRSEVGEWNVSQAGVVRPDAARPGDVRPMLDLLPAAQRCAIDPVAAFELAHGRRAIGVVSPEADPALPLAAVFNDELVAMVDVDLESPLASVPPEGSVVLKPRTVFVRPEELTAEVPA